jgi:hypothetical protein
VETLTSCSRRKGDVEDIRDAPGRENLRFWDLIDLMLVEELLGDDLAEVREAAEAVFRARGTHEWPPELVVPEAWREPYARTATDVGANLPPDVDQAAERGRALIARVSGTRRG